MSYIVESGASSSRRARRRRALITLGLVALMLFFAFWYAYSYFEASDGRPSTATKPTCTTTAAPALTPAGVTVNVYNATDRSGLAATTASAVRKRGYRIATVANDPLQKTVSGPAEVRYGTTGRPGARLVLTLVKGAKAVKDSRTDSSVDLVLGDKFTVLAAAAKAKPSPTTTKPC
ncbi:LytR C-terminal domain-containing protein [Phycicoccus sp. Soil748]|uniref:LytR C-terminal domain-containing protein n=1 Tax=Intrasporangiaceae TaxID=85021 RepID=UPI0007033287|nr:LytR C-terminal domain-containing protein [Phycicoccus sp. Soil748]KRE56292.1 hypothetical protein ASG70_03910 [Phycicoccus sp. Soil748]